jgi:hypothetical protein
MLKKQILFFGIFIICFTMSILRADDTLVITGEGNVGIGVDDPEEQLEVGGDMRVNGDITAGWFSSLNDTVVFFDLSTGAVTHNLPDAVDNKGLHIVMWKGGDITTKILTLQGYNNQTIDNKPASTWIGQGKGKIILAPYSSNWVVVDYIDSGSTSGTGFQIYFQKFADGTMRQWGKKDGTSPINVGFIIDFFDAYTGYSGESVVTVGAPHSLCYTANGYTGTPPDADNFYLYIRRRDDHQYWENSITGHWSADGRWY